MAKAVGDRLIINSDLLHNHIANCPRCQRRLSGYSQVSLGLTLIKSQPHQPDLLSRANCLAVKYLKRSLRDTPKANILKQAKPRPTWLERCSRYTHSIGNAAACFAILLLLRAGIFSSMGQLQNKGTNAVNQYYRHHLGDDAEVLFSSAKDQKNIHSLNQQTPLESRRETS